MLFRSPPIDDQIPMASATGIVPATVVLPNAILVVHVTGAVREPGVFRLPSSSRVIDAVAAAGGTTPMADTVAVNFAATLVDGAQVFIPQRGRSTTTSIARPRPGVNPPPTPMAPQITVPSPVGGTTPTGALVNLNTASLAELDSLPGIGPSTAQAIIDYRVVKGRFKTVEDLLNVRGIGKAKLAAIRSRVSV